jgi:hypothetical protein
MKLIADVFLSAPFRSKIDRTTNEIDKASKELIISLIDWLEKKGFSVYLAHRREEWGRKKYSLENIVWSDFESLKHSDLFIAPIDSTKSIGVPIEIGWASAMDKKIIIIFNSHHLPFFVKGLSTICRDFKIITVSDEKDLLKDLCSFV